MQKQWEIMMRIDIDFDSKKTAFVQGIAVLMMLSLHLFHYPQWIDCSQVWYGILINKNIEHITGEFGVLCINIFCFKWLWLEHKIWRKEFYNKAYN